MSFPPAQSSPYASLDIRQLYASQTRRENSKRGLYEVVVEKVHHRIQTVAARSETRCIFQVPPYMIGMPLYDAFQCSGYVIQRLKNEGFIVQYAHPNVLAINWDKDAIEPYVRALEKREQAQRESERLQQLRIAPAARGSGSMSAAAPAPSTGASIAYTPTGKLFGDNR